MTTNSMMSSRKIYLFRNKKVYKCNRKKAYKRVCKGKHFYKNDSKMMTHYQRNQSYRTIFYGLLILLVVALSATIWHVAFKRDIYRGRILTQPLMAGEYQPVEGVCRIILARHGETEWNARGLPQGWADIPLNETGKTQAEELAKNLSGIHVDAILTSALSRAVDTAKKVAEFHPDCPVIPDYELRFFPHKDEQVLDMPRKARKKAIADEIARLATAYFKEASQQYLGKNVVVITHGKVIRHLVESLTGKKYYKVRIDNGAIVTILVTNDSLVLEKL